MFSDVANSNNAVEIQEYLSKMQKASGTKYYSSIKLQFDKAEDNRLKFLVNVEVREEIPPLEAKYFEILKKIPHPYD